MNQYVNIFFSMLISSNTLLLLYIVVMYFKGDIFNQKYQYGILKVALFMAILPIAFIKPAVKHIIFQFFTIPNQGDLFIPGKNQAITLTPHGFYRNVVYKNNLWITYIWLGMAILIFALYLYKHLKFRKWILSTVYEPEQSEPSHFVNIYREKLHIRRKVKICVTKTPVSPFTIGILSPIIILPDFLETENLELIIHHELCHIKHKDALIRFLRIIVVGIYWFDPLVYLLDSYLEAHCELACDERVTKHLDREKKKNYGYLIIDMASFNTSISPYYITPFSNDKKNIKTRMELIMKKRKGANKVALLLSVGMIICSSFTAFAYQEPQSIILMEQPQENIFLENTNQSIQFMKNGAPVHPIRFDSQFTDENGNVFYVNTGQEPRKTCTTHTFVSGEYEKHTKNKDGSCVARAYQAQRCTNCGGIKVGAFIRETKYAVCPH